MAAIVQVESEGNPLVIHDNTLGRSFIPRDANQGAVWASELLSRNHSIDLGISQINSANLSRLGLTVRDALDPCLNLRSGATILKANYRAAVARFGRGQYALRSAIGAYNTGSLYAGQGYIARVLSAARAAADDSLDRGLPVPDLTGAGSTSPVRVRLRRQAVPAKGDPVRKLSKSPYSAPILMLSSDTRSRSATAPRTSPEKAQILVSSQPAVTPETSAPPP